MASTDNSHSNDNDKFLYNWTKSTEIWNKNDNKTDNPNSTHIPGSWFGSGEEKVTNPPSLGKENDRSDGSEDVTSQPVLSQPDHRSANSKDKSTNSIYPPTDNTGESTRHFLLLAPSRNVPTNLVDELPAAAGIRSWPCSQASSFTLSNQQQAVVHRSSTDRFDPHIYSKTRYLTPSQPPTPGNTIISCSERVPVSRTNQIISLAADQLIPATSTSHETRVRHFPDPAPSLNEPATADELMAAAGSGSPSSSQASKNYSCTEQSHLAASFTSAGFRNNIDPLHLSPEQQISNKSRAKHFPDPALTLNVPAIADELLAAAGSGSPSAPLASTSRSSADQLNLAPSVASTGSLDVEDEDLAPQGSRTFAIQWNVSGLRTHRSELQLLLAKYQPALVCLHETNAQELKVPADYIGKDYHLILGPCSTQGRQGAGLAVKNGIHYDRIQLITDVQAVAVQVHSPHKLTVASVYLSPNDKDAASKFNNLLAELPKPALILGDLNAHHPAWGSRMTNVSKAAQKRGSQILEQIVRHDMLVLNDKTHTRLDPVSGNTQALDVSICSTAIAYKFEWNVVPDCGDSDHFPILIKEPGDPDVTTCRRKWIYDRANWRLFEELTSQSIRPGQALTVKEFTSRIITAAEASIPRTSGKPGRKAVSWWNQDVAQAVKTRRKRLRALRRMEENDPRKPEALKLFQEARKHCRKIIQDAKQTSWENFVQSINTETTSSEVWNRVNRLLGKRQSNMISLNLPDGFTNNGKAVANALAEEYHKKSSDANYNAKFLKKNLKNKKNISKSIRPNLFKRYNIDFCIEELQWALKRRGGTSTGTDTIGYQLLQHLPFSCKIALLELYNTMWAEGEFPAQWKEGLVIPIPKPGADLSKPEGYRPITLLSCMGKLFERMINRRLITELESTGKLDHRQYAFRAGKGVEAHLAHLESLLSYGENNHTEIVSLDISKAYDTTWRPAILRTLATWKITGRMLYILQSFLQNRNFRVIANGMESQLKSAENGVAQGSILSVTLFLIAMQPIFTICPPDVQVLLYADDVLLVSTGGSTSQVRKQLRAAVCSIVEWTTSVGFNIAPKKSQLIHFCSLNHRKRGRAIKINNTPIPRVRKMRILGVLVDSRLNFLQHFSNIQKNCSTRMNVIRILGSRLKRSHRTILLNVGSALIVSKLLFGLVLTSTNFEAMVKRLGPTYNNMIRLATGAFCTSPVLSIMAEAGVLPFQLLLVQRLSQLAARLEEKGAGNSKLPIIKRAADLFEETTGSTLPAVCKVQRLGQKEWYAKQIQIEDTLEKSTKAGEPKETATSKFHELIATKYPDHKQIYTDGSKEGESTGVGVVSGSTQISLPLPGLCSVFSSEAYALKEALSTICKNENFLILSDSASCLNALKKGHSKHPWIQEVERAAEGSKVTFCWIPAHVGIVGNEAADSLAKKGRAYPPPNIPIPYQDVLHHIKQQLWSTWENTWHSTHSQLRKIKPSPLKYDDRRCASEQRMLTRLRIGHTRLTHSYLLERSHPPVCDYCGTRLTIEHILTDCRGFTKERQDCSIYGTIVDILGNTSEREIAVLKYFKICNLTDKI